MVQRSSSSKETAEKFIKEDTSSSPKKYTVLTADKLRESFQFLFMCHGFNSNEETLCEACEFAVCLLLFRIKKKKKNHQKAKLHKLVIDTRKMH